MKISDCTEKYNEITKELLWTYGMKVTRENLIFSPFSMMMLLTMLADATESDTRKEILQILGAEGSFEEFKKMMTRMQYTFIKSNTLCSENVVVAKNAIADTVKESYLSSLRSHFSGKLFATNHGVQQVNEWVNKRTKGMIQEIADSSMGQIELGMINAIAFNSKWDEKYKEADVLKGKFHNCDGTISTVNMLKSEETSYLEDEFFIGFSKMYKGKEYSYVALLPKKKTSKSFLMRGIEQLDFTKLLKNSRECCVSVTMPEFKSSFELNISEFLQEKEMTKIFSFEADFSPLSDLPLRVDALRHKARIEVDREGTRAAAVTYGVVVCSAQVFDELKIVTLDRPFIYAVVHNDTALPVLTGIMNYAE